MRCYLCFFCIFEIQIQRLSVYLFFLFIGRAFLKLSLIHFHTSIHMVSFAILIYRFTPTFYTIQNIYLLLLIELSHLLDLPPSQNLYRTDVTRFKNAARHWAGPKTIWWPWRTVTYLIPLVMSSYQHLDVQVNDAWPHRYS